jgi:hypothetical protein
MSSIGPPCQVPNSIASAKQKAKKYFRKFMQEFAEVTSVPHALAARVLRQGFY